MPDNPEITIHTTEGVTVASVESSSILNPQCVEAVRAKLFDLVQQQGPSKLILDISKVEHLSSAALGMLINLQETCRKQTGQLILVGATDAIAKLFEITKLSKLFRLAKTERDAMQLLGVSKT